MTSGATYWGVPQMVLIWLSAIFLARPKSAILTAGTSFSVAGRCSSRFSSFRSRWLMLLQCQHARSQLHGEAILSLSLSLPMTM